MTLPPEIFKAYDIRGVVGKTLTTPIVRAIGQTLGTLALEAGRDALVVGRDGRLSGPELAAAVADGIRAAGANVIDVGMVTTPMSYFAANHLDTQSSVMVTGSHNPPDYNGLKIVIDGVTLSGDDIQNIRARIESVLAAKPPLSARELAVDGHDLMATLSIRPGPRLGALLDQLVERVLDDPALNTHERLLDLARELLPTLP